MRIALLVALTLGVLSAREPVRFQKAMVVTQEAHAADVGREVLKSGGNAVDAAVAVAAALNVVEPFMSSAAGIGLMVISRTRPRERHVLDFIGGAPAAAPAGAALAGVTEDDLVGGPKACATPGNLGGWMAALERFGSMPRSRGPARCRRRSWRQTASFYNYCN
jgi:gamma-glutamyltranspeptidase/glutathione hydrolase